MWSGCDTDVVDGLDRERAVDLDFDIESLHVLTGTSLILIAEEDGLELWDIWRDFTEIVGPLVLAAAAVPLAVAVHAVVVHRGGVGPAHFARELSVCGLGGIVSGATSLSALLL